jgi:acyl-CoA thioester hydrolase
VGVSVSVKDNTSVRVFTYELDVSGSAIDENGHVNNVEYVHWMQLAAEAHADMAGCTAATRVDGATWFVRSHHIEYLKPANLGDHIRVRTWVADFRRVASLRKYEMYRGEVLVARGETDWIYVDTSTGRPKAIPQEIADLFQIGEA